MRKDLTDVVVIILAVDGFKILLLGLVLAKKVIEPVFDVVVDSFRHKLFDLDPFVAEHLVQFHELNVLSDGPLHLIEFWIKVIIPPLTAMLSDSTR